MLKEGVKGFKMISFPSSLDALEFTGLFKVAVRLHFASKGVRITITAFPKLMKQLLG